MRVLIDRGIPAAFWRKLLTGPVLPGNERFYVSGPNQTVVWELKVYLSFRRFVDASIENGGGDQTARVISISSALYLASGRFRHTRWRRCADPSREFPPQFNTRGQDVTSSDSSRRFSRLPRAAYPTNRQRDDHHVSFSRHNFSARHAPVPTEASCAKGRCHHQGLYGRHELGSAESSTDLRKRSRRCHRGGPPVGGQG